MEHIRYVGQFTRQFSDQSPYDTEFQTLYADFLKKVQYLDEITAEDVYWDEMSKLNTLCQRLFSKHFDPSFQVLAKDPSTSRFILDLKDELLDVQSKLKESCE